MWENNYHFILILLLICLSGCSKHLSDDSKNKDKVEYALNFGSIRIFTSYNNVYMSDTNYFKNKSKYFIDVLRDYPVTFEKLKEKAFFLKRSLDYYFYTKVPLEYTLITFGFEGDSLEFTKSNLNKLQVRFIRLEIAKAVPISPDDYKVKRIIFNMR